MPDQTQPMPRARVQRSTHRSIRERWVIEGQLILETPAHFGTGEAGDWSDMPVFVDEADGAPLLPGTSIAGALRNYLREVEVGDGVPFPARPRKQAGQSEEDVDQVHQARQRAERQHWTTLLFGGYRGDADGLQSPLIVHDARGAASDYELRDGVAIDAATRTAAEDKKFDVQLLAAGTTFDLRFELMAGVPASPFRAAPEWSSETAYVAYRTELLQALATALDGLTHGVLALGTRKRRGYGQCLVKQWVVKHYDLTQPHDFLAWLASEQEDAATWCSPVEQIVSADIAQALGVTRHEANAHQRVTLEATFAVAGSLLIRSGFGESDTGPDMVHLHARHADRAGRVPIVPGTSWAGVLRQRAGQIARTLAGSGDSADKRVTELLDGIFGPAEITGDDRYVCASRLSVAETEVMGGQSLVQSRVKIDRFTGGAYESALFDEQPVFEAEQVTLRLMLRPPSPDDPLTRKRADNTAEVGLLLLLLKDLWTGDLLIGGEVSVGRGRLHGQTATLTMGSERWVLTQKADARLSIDGDPNRLQLFVDAFNQRMVGHV